MGNSPEQSPWESPPRVAHVQRLLDSYRHWLRAELIDREGTAGEQAARLFAAPFVVVSHGIEADPILNYGNRAALELWEMDFATLTRTPSRQTAEPLHRRERARLLERTARQGYVDDYRGIRISSGGRRFLIARATVWNLLDDRRQPAGQAACFSDWEFLEPEPPRP